jgi:hypothetical protein
LRRLHARLARYYAQWLPIRLVKPPVEIPPIVEVMQWHRFRDGDRGLDWFRRALTDAMSPDARARESVFRDSAYHNNRLARSRIRR